MKRVVRIIGGPSSAPGEIQIIDAGTGLQVPGVRGITIDAPFDDAVTATLDVVAEIDLVAEGTIRRLRLNDETGEYEPIVEAYRPGDELTQNSTGRSATVDTVIYQKGEAAKARVRFEDGPWIMWALWELDKNFTRVAGGDGGELR